MVVDVAAAELDRLHERIGGRFGRSEQRARVREDVSGLVAGLERKNGWTLAERAGEASPDGMQRLLGSAGWDTRGVRDDVREYVSENLGDVGGVLIADETGFVEEGHPLGRGAAAVLRHGGADGELPDRGVLGLCLPPWACADRPGTVYPGLVGGGPGPVPGGRHPR